MARKPQELQINVERASDRADSKDRNRQRGSEWEDCAAYLNACAPGGSGRLLRVKDCFLLFSFSRESCLEAHQLWTHSTAGVHSFPMHININSSHQRAILHASKAESMPWDYCGLRCTNSSVPPSRL